MKKSLMAVTASLGLLTSCAAHYHQIKADRVSIYLKIPGAQVVGFASSLDDYQIHPARKTENEAWVIVVPAGAEFKYFYMVDGNMYLPACRLKEKDDFGSENCIFTPDT
ncbi:MAG: hypothetical protein JSW39_24345 [Desulfobacterales bacterium]|nr:MAG: hypothetical protein JSW39_24345 [Desulfobacterales bacterium]